MILDLIVYNKLPSDTLDINPMTSYFVMKTCQRHLYIGIGPVFEESLPIHNTSQIFKRENAYQFILEVMCGLKSQVLGENEIMSQFKEAYQVYLNGPHKNSLLISIIERLMKDSKVVRTEYLMQIGQMSYAGLSRNIVYQSKKSGRVLILGSGKLTIDLIKLFKKKYEIYISARNLEKVGEISLEYGVSPIEWDDQASYQNFDIILNTIGVESFILFNHSFFKELKSNHQDFHFIDLGSPSSIDTEYTKNDGVYRLNDLFSISKELDLDKNQKVEEAKLFIEQLSKERLYSMSVHFPYGWEELKFVY